MHDLSGDCPSCLNIFSKYSNFNSQLQNWFKEIQSKHPEAHISCAGRGRLSQEELYQENRSRAPWGHSAHNYNAAVDIFELRGDRAVWDREWFDRIIGAQLMPEFKWYGYPGSEFYELPHVEISNWRVQLAQGLLHPVE